jgi:hypothetical protein
MRNSSDRARLALLAALYAGLALVAHATGKPDASGHEVSEAGRAHPEGPKPNVQGSREVAGQ